MYVTPYHTSTVWYWEPIQSYVLSAVDKTTTAVENCYSENTAVMWYAMMYSLILIGLADKTQYDQGMADQMRVLLVKQDEDRQVQNNTLSSLEGL